MVKCPQTFGYTLHTHSRGSEAPLFAICALKDNSQEVAVQLTGLESMRSITDQESTKHEMRVSLSTGEFDWVDHGGVCFPSSQEGGLLLIWDLWVELQDEELLTKQCRRLLTLIRLQGKSWVNKKQSLLLTYLAHNRAYVWSQKWENAICRHLLDVRFHLCKAGAKNSLSQAAPSWEKHRGGGIFSSLKDKSHAS